MFEKPYLVAGKEASYKLRAITVLENTEKMGDYIYNIGGYDLAAGYEFISDYMLKSNIQFISSNLFLKNTDKLAFSDHVIIEDSGLKIGIFGITNMLPEAARNSLEIKNFSSIAKAKISELNPQVDILVMLLNASKKEYSGRLNDFNGVDYIFSSLEEGRTRPEREQPSGNPFQYSLGVQGKYIARLDLKIADKSKPLIDVTSSVMMADLFQNRLDNLQKRDPKKSLETIYKNSPKVLMAVEKFQSGLAASELVVKKTVNQSYYSLIPLNSNVASMKSTLKVVDNVLEICKKLDKKGIAMNRKKLLNDGTIMPDLEKLKINGKVPSVLPYTKS